MYIVSVYNYKAPVGSMERKELLTWMALENDLYYRPFLRVISRIELLGGQENYDLIYKGRNNLIFNWDEYLDQTLKDPKLHQTKYRYYLTNQITPTHERYFNPDINPSGDTIRPLWENDLYRNQKILYAATSIVGVSIGVSILGIFMYNTM